MPSSKGQKLAKGAKRLQKRARAITQREERAPQNLLPMNPHYWMKVVTPQEQELIAQTIAKISLDPRAKKQT
jgi:hypothetical protein